MKAILKRKDGEVCSVCDDPLTHNRISIGEGGDVQSSERATRAGVYPLYFSTPRIGSLLVLFSIRLSLSWHCTVSIGFNILGIKKERKIERSRSPFPSRTSCKQ